jgi:hypothetical protein
VFGGWGGPTCIVDMLAARASPSRPLKLRLRYLFAASEPPCASCESSALLARLCPGRPVPACSPLMKGRACVGVMVEALPWVGVEDPVAMLVDESVLDAPRL